MKPQQENRINEFPGSVIFWGGTGQAKAMRPIVEHFGGKVIAVFDDTPNLIPPFSDIELFHAWDAFERWITRRDASKIGFCIAIGNPHGRVRLNLHDRLTQAGLRAISLAHPTAWIEKNASIAEGAQIHAGAIVGAETIVGRQCIINTNASVDHECRLGDGVEIGPGATLCGQIVLDTNAWVCAGATVLPRLSIGADAIVGAGAVVIRHVAANSIVAGVPAIPLNRSSRKKA